MRAETRVRRIHADNLRDVAKGLKKIRLLNFADSCESAAVYLSELTRAKLSAERTRTIRPAKRRRRPPEVKS